MHLRGSCYALGILENDHKSMIFKEKLFGSCYA